MDQSTVIAAVVLAGFILFLAAKNRLTAYTAVLWGPTQAPLPNLPSAKGGSPLMPSPAPSSPGPSSLLDQLGISDLVEAI